MKVINKQANSKMCLICGLENQAGVKAPFYNMEDGSIVSIFQFSDIHQSFPGRTHGGMIASMLDEVMGRAVWVHDDCIYGVTTSMTIKFRKPVPYNTKLKAKAKVNTESSRFFTASGWIFDMQGNLLAEGEGNYMKLDHNKIVDNSVNLDEEICYIENDGVIDIE